MAGVSQTTVSLVLNNRTDAEVRIAQETRERVMQVIRETGYVADPVARRLADRRNRILGVFTYEAVFPSRSVDFYHPFLLGIEACAEEVGSDLLLFTSARTTDGGRRRIFNEDSRVRLADGCLLLGRSVDRDDLTRLLAEGVPFVSVGRRDDAGGPVPYVGADYPSAVRELVERAVALGHRRLGYVGVGTAESQADRLRGFRQAVAAMGVEGIHVLVPAGGPAGLLRELAAQRVTAVFAEDPGQAVAILDAARAGGLTIPEDLSILSLGTPPRAGDLDVVFTGFRIPRRQMGHRSVQVLTELMERGQGAPQELLPCELVAGDTLTTIRQPSREF
ncbi:MAG: LacI family transcriptional regulator [Streptosporangiaceae bacterium]|nr:LacI family transcriptional regulator [Streptosporangiaceae bacterium]